MAGLSGPTRCLLLLWVLICSLAHLAHGASMQCHSIVRPGLRCRWPEESLECHCIPNAECSTSTNACKCLPGYTGDYCDQSCAHDSNGDCLSDCVSSPYCQALSSCTQETDICMCKNGYSGKDCNLCDHNVLSDCALCPYESCQNNGKCDLVIRQCACADGYTGSYCSLCYPDLHPNGCGDHCDLSCVHSYCDTHTGACSCPYGLDIVANCSFCDPTRASDGCMRFCHTICRGGGLCNIEQKRCMCEDGFVGNDCRLCDPRTHPTSCMEFCHSECLNDGYCDVLTGTCMCQPGYEVTYNCGLCRPSLHSEACVNHCDPPCRNGGDCLSTQGMCMCPVGYTNHDCGVCIPSLHARNCSDHCPLCHNHATCDTVSGACVCAAGWTGPTCDNTCPRGTFGVGCQQCDCGSHQCDVVTGACIIKTTTLKPTTTMVPPTTTATTRAATTTPATTSSPTTTPATTESSTKATTTATTTITPSTQRLTTDDVTTGLPSTRPPTTGPLSMIDLTSTERQGRMTSSAGAVPLRTQQSPNDLMSLAPGLVLESRQNMSSTYVIAIIISSIALIVLLSFLIAYFVYDRRKREKRDHTEPAPEEIPLNNIVTNNLDNGRSSNLYFDGMVLTRSGDGDPEMDSCAARRSLSDEQMQRLSRISGDVAFFAKIPNTVAAGNNPNVFQEKKGNKEKYWEDAGALKPKNNEGDTLCKGGGDSVEEEKALCKGAGAEVSSESDAMLGACGGAGLRFGPDATSTPKKPLDSDNRIYEEVIITQHDPTAIRNPRMSGEYYLLEPALAWSGSGGGGGSSQGESDKPPKTFQDDKSGQESTQRRSADSGIEQAAIPPLSPHYEQLERPLDFAQARSPTLARTEKGEDERDSGVYAHLTRGPMEKGYNRLDFSPGRERKTNEVELYSENQYARLNDQEDDSMSD